jgi:FKBP-type peptidyl-prolyl cis-trans isomerase FkpA/FKBP-type peptidyl-prolyl cis-trans isomerase FklB
MKTSRILGVAAAIALFAAALPVQSADPTLSTDDQKTVYAMGYSLAGSLDRFALSPEEIEILIVGLRDGTTSATAKAPVEEYAAKIAAFGQTRSAAAAQVEKKSADEFLAKEGAVSGASKSQTGLVKRVLKTGSGASPKAEDTVKVHYHGTLRDGSVFDSSVERNEPAEFPLNRVIPCWTEAVQTMKVGEKAHITCPSEIAYGDRGFPPKIKGGAALAFDVELLEIVKAPAAATPPPTSTPKE